MISTTIGGAIAAPSLLALWVIPWTKPRSSRGYHSCIARVAPGNAPASPMPKRKRTTTNETTLLAAAVAAVMTDQYATMVAKTGRAQKRSLSQPPGTRNSAYAHATALKRMPMATLSKPHSWLITGDRFGARPVLATIVAYWSVM